MNPAPLERIAFTTAAWPILIAGVASLAGIRPAAAYPGPAQAKAARTEQARRDLTPKSFAPLHELVRPHADEGRHLQVQWLTDVVAARKKAAAEDKPIISCYTGGAGYNEPLGVC